MLQLSLPDMEAESSLPAAAAGARGSRRPGVGLSACVIGFATEICVKYRCLILLIRLQRNARQLIAKNCAGRRGTWGNAAAIFGPAAALFRFSGAAFTTAGCGR